MRCFDFNPGGENVGSTGEEGCGGVCKVKLVGAVWGAGYGVHSASAGKTPHPIVDDPLPFKHHATANWE
jgi:hypothetical protein